METISLTSAIMDCHLTEHNWLQFVAEGHSITYRDAQSGSLPYKGQCPNCVSRSMHTDETKRLYHGQDKIFCLNLFTPGTDPNNWKETGVQCIRVQAPTKEEVIRLMQQAIVDTVYAFGRQEYAKQFQQSQLDKLKLTQDQIHVFVTKNMAVPEGETPVDTAMRAVRELIKHNKGVDSLPTDNDELLPQSWRRDR